MVKRAAVLFASIIGVLIMLPAPARADFNIFRNGDPTCNNTQSKTTVCAVCNGNTNTSTICSQPAEVTQDPVVSTLNTAVNIMATVAGLVAVIMIIASGLSLVTSGGNAEAVTNSRKRIANALIGVIIVALAWAIIRFVTDKFIK